MLGWPIFFNIPIFFLFYSGGGRFYKAPELALVITALALAFDRDFYKDIRLKFNKFLLTAIITLSIVWLGPLLDEYLINNETLRYWAPFSDPSLCSLNVIEENHE